MPYGVPDSEYGFIRKYVESLPEELRASVAPVINQQRAEADANFNSRFEQMSGELEQWKQYGEAANPAMQIMAEIMDPETSDQRLAWLVDQLEESYGIEGVKEKLTQHWSGSEEPATQKQTSMQAEDLETLIDQKIQKASEEWEREAQEQERAERARQETERIIRERAKERGADLDDLQVDYILFRSYDQVQRAQGTNDGREPSEILNNVVDEVVTATKPASSSGGMPTLATGDGSAGAPPELPPDLDMTKREDRLAKMLHVFETSKE